MKSNQMTFPKEEDQSAKNFGLFMFCHLGFYNSTLRFNGDEDGLRLSLRQCHSANACGKKRFCIVSLPEERHLAAKKTVINSTAAKSFSAFKSEFPE